MVKTVPEILPCTSTSFPYIDNFDSPDLDSCWFWIREDTSHWSLTERPGWMRIITQRGNTFCPENNNTFVRNRPSEDFVAETHLHFTPQGYCNMAGIILRTPDSCIMLHRSFSYDCGRLYFQRLYGCNADPNIWTCNADTNIYLRLTLRGTLVEASWSSDRATWNFLYAYMGSWLADPDLKVGILAQNGDVDGPGTPADFDYFRVDPLPGTTVCGDVSGVWDSTGSPYYVTCDVTVPAGQTLEIQPGVQVLFTGHYKFNVFGNLQAIGTEEDSIIFTRAFPTEESKWWGIRFADSADDLCRLDYCIIEHGIATGTGQDGTGGGIMIDRCDVTIAHCSVRQNQATDGGAVAVWGDCNPVLSYCELANNTADSIIGSGGAVLHQPDPTNGGNIVLDRCAMHHNSAGGGGAVWQGRSNFELINCTISQCESNAAIVLWHSVGYQMVMRDCIVWGNPASFYFGEGPGTVNATYSDIQGGYPGIGNIDADPMFVDAEN